MNYYEKVKEFYWKTLEQDFLTNPQEAKKFQQALILLEEEPHKVDQMVKEDQELKNMFAEEFLQVINDFTEEEDSSDNESIQSSDNNSSIKETFKMNNEEKPFQFPHMEPGLATGQTSQGTKGTKRKGEFYPPSTEFKVHQSAYGSNTLYLDCKPDRKQLIDVWAKEISLIIQTNPEQYDDQSTVLLLLDHKTAGNVNKFIKETTWQPLLSPITTFNAVLDGIYAMFLGIDYISSKDSELEKVKSNAKMQLSKMQICDICQLEQFYCDYERHLYDTGNQSEYESYIMEYMRKIPLIGEKALNRFISEKTNITRFSLAFAHKLVKEEIAKICDLTRKQKQLKSFSKRCCEKIVEQSISYGCTPQYRQKNKKKHFKRKASKYRFKRKYKSFKPGKFVRKKNQDFSYKKKFCPKGKKNCRCWVCNEEGHYANECPNRQQNSEKLKVLEEILDQGFLPIEDEYEGCEDIYIFEFDPGKTSESETDEQSSESD